MKRKPTMKKMLPRREIQRRTMRRRMTVMEILSPLMIRRIQNPQMKRMAIPAMRMLPISLVLLTMEMQIQRIRIHQRILEILTNQTTQMALAALIQRIHRHVPTYLCFWCAYWPDGGYPSAHKLIVYAAEKDDASDTAATSDGADNAKKNRHSIYIR